MPRPAASGPGWTTNSLDQFKTDRHGVARRDSSIAADGGLDRQQIAIVHATLPIWARTRTEPKPRLVPVAADSSRISTASSGGMLRKCQLPPVPLHSQRGAVTVIISELPYAPL